MNRRVRPKQSVAWSCAARARLAAAVPVQLTFTPPALARASDRLVSLSVSTPTDGHRLQPLRRGRSLPLAACLPKLCSRCRFNQMALKDRSKNRRPLQRQPPQRDWAKALDALARVCFQINDVANPACGTLNPLVFVAPRSAEPGGCVPWCPRPVERCSPGIVWSRAQVRRGPADTPCVTSCSNPTGCRRAVGDALGQRWACSTLARA